MKCDNDQKVGTSLLQAVQTTLMEMTFIDVIPSEDSSEIGDTNVIFISFNDPFHGGLLMKMPKDCKMKIVENIHGSNWDSLSGDEIDDCLLEVLNVLAGNFLKFYCGEERNFNMSFPQILFEEREIPHREQYNPYYFDAEGVVFEAAVCIGES